jgi:hypothetical protein
MPLNKWAKILSLIINKEKQGFKSDMKINVHKFAKLNVQVNVYFPLESWYHKCRKFQNLTTHLVNYEIM